MNLTDEESNAIQIIIDAGVRHLGGQLYARNIDVPLRGAIEKILNPQKQVTDNGEADVEH